MATIKTFFKKINESLNTIKLNTNIKDFILVEIQENIYTFKTNEDILYLIKFDSNENKIWVRRQPRDKKNHIIQYTVDDNNFISEGNQITLLENGKMNVGNGHKNPNEVKDKLIEYGLNKNLIIIKLMDISNPNYKDFIPDLLKWIQLRDKVKIEYENNISKLSSDTVNLKGKIISIELKKALNTILYGPPGTGKTYNTIELAVKIIENTNSNKKITSNEEKTDREKIVEKYKEFAGNKTLSFNDTALDANQIEFVTFHQNYTYEDFVIGLKPNIANDAQLTFKQNYGIFYRMCKTAYNNLDKNYVLIIDEINRANISRVFGELITLLEDDKRIGAENELIISLPNGESFGVPSNLYLIGTMNTADKSIALIDIALRRRFEFEGKFPEPELIVDTEKWKESKKAQSLLRKINENIIKSGKTSDFTIGHAFFMKELEITKVIKTKIIPLLMEYFNNNSKKVTEIFIESGYTITYDEVKYEWNVSL